MASAEYRIESNQPLFNRLLPLAEGRQALFGDRGLAVALAAKNYVRRFDQEIRVVHVPTGEVVFRKNEGQREVVTD